MSKLLPIVLAAKKGNWQSFMGRKSNKTFIKVSQKIFERDANTCRYCGFQSEKFQEIVNIDQNYQRNVLDNMATACNFCAQCFFIDSLGLDGKSGGSLIYLPEISQADLNHFSRTLFCSLLKDSPYKGKLQSVYLSLSDRSQPVETVFGAGAKEPSIFGQTMIDSGLTESQQQHPIFLDLKILPNRKFYKTQASYWKTTAFAHIPL